MIDMSISWENKTYCSERGLFSYSKDNTYSGKSVFEIVNIGGVINCTKPSLGLLNKKYIIRCTIRSTLMDVLLDVYLSVPNKGGDEVFYSF